MNIERKIIMNFRYQRLLYLLWKHVRLQKLLPCVRIGKCIAFLLPSLFVIGCKNNFDPNVIEEIRLEDGGTQMTFLMPETYRAKKPTNHLMIIRCKYPSMEPLNPDGLSRPDEIYIFVELSADSGGRTEFRIRNAINDYDPNRPSAEYRAGREGTYDIYHTHIGEQEPRTQTTTYVFKAQDGKFVGVEDPGDWSVKFNADRKIGDTLHIRYLIAKPIGRDFIQIDQIVTNFLRNHIKSMSNKG